jgi:hypothetical protein
VRQIVAGDCPIQSLATAAVGLDRLLAPLTLHPSQLLARLQRCAHNPPMAGRLDDRLAGDTAVKGLELQDAATEEGPGPISVAVDRSPRS